MKIQIVAFWVVMPCSYVKAQKITICTILWITHSKQGVECEGIWKQSVEENI